MGKRPGARYVTGGAVITALGLLSFVLYVGYLTVHEAYMTGPIWLLAIGILLIGVLSVGLAYGGYWITTSEFTVDQEWRVTIWLFAGLIAALALTFWPIFYQRLVGVAIEDPMFILLVSSTLGANAGVVAGISEIRSEQRFQHVEHARDSMRFLNRLLRHNILNAVAIIRGNAELLEGKAASETVVERAQTIRDQSNQIADLIQNTQVLVRHIEGETELEDVDFSSIVANELETARRTYKQAVLESDLASCVEIRADPLVSAVVENLLTNAIDHNDRETPHVEVTLETEDESAVLRIEDNGPGLPDESEESLTEPGEHGDRGLGLYLVDTLVSQYGGELSLEEAEPRGTRVTVSLPLA